MHSQIASSLGAFLVLAAYYGLQSKRLRETDLNYLHLNLLGGTLLFLASCTTGQAGLIILEGTWVGVTVYGYIRRRRYQTKV